MVLTNKNNTSANINFKEGTVILVDKPLEWTSFDVVNKIRYQLKRVQGKMKVGHAGTLDPLATGLLIICTGKKTKTITDFQNLPKTYTGQFKLGATTPSFDRETDENAKFNVDHIDSDLLTATSTQFLGLQEQMPPVFSAIKVDGVTAYNKARKGQEVALKTRSVEIKTFDITQFEEDLVDFEVHCSKGTYIRSLANDFGAALDSGAYLWSLKRTAIGDYNLDDAWQLDDLVKFIERHAVDDD